MGRGVARSFAWSGLTARWTGSPAGTRPLAQRCQRRATASGSSASAGPRGGHLAESDGTCLAATPSAPRPTDAGVAASLRRRRSSSSGCRSMTHSRRRSCPVKRGTCSPFIVPESKRALDCVRGEIAAPQLIITRCDHARHDDRIQVATHSADGRQWPASRGRLVFGTA